MPTFELDDLQPHSDPARNYDITLSEDESVLIIRVPLRGGGTATRTGRNTSIASTKGNRLIRGTSIRVGLNVYHETDITPGHVARGRPVDPLEAGDTHPDHRPPATPASQQPSSIARSSDLSLYQKRKLQAQRRAAREAQAPDAST